MAALLLGLLAGPLSGCLILEDDVVYPDLPRKKNSPPRINLEAAMSPANREVVVHMGTCEALDFFVSVDDDDVSDTLRSLWFIDPGDYTNAQSIVPGKPVAGGTATTRKVSAPVALYNQLGKYLGASKHRVEVWVTDSDFEITSSGLRVVQPTPGATDGGAPAQATYYADSLTWLMTVQGCEQP